MIIFNWFKSKLTKKPKISEQVNREFAPVDPRVKPDVPSNSDQYSEYLLGENRFYGLQLISSNMTSLITLDKALSERLLATLNSGKNSVLSMSGNGVSVTIVIQADSAQAIRAQSVIENRLFKDIPLPEILRTN